MSTIVIAKYRADPANGQGWSHEVAIEAGFEEPPEITFLRVVPDPGAFYRYPGCEDH